MPAAVNGLKECTKCKETKKVDEFNNQKDKGDGKASQCRSCVKATPRKQGDLQKKREYYYENREKAKKYYERAKLRKASPRPKECTKCSIVKEPEEFSKRVAGIDGLRTECKACVNAQGPAKSREYRRKYPDRVREQNKRAGEKHRDKRNTYSKEWQKANPHVRRKAKAVRRVRLKKARVEDVDLSIVWENSNALCFLCTYPMDRQYEYPDPRFPSLEHIVPLSREGTHTYDNLTYTHLRCNNKKLHKLVEELNLPFDPPVV